jgi:hypothetical protein
VIPGWQDMATAMAEISAAEEVLNRGVQARG